MLAHTLGSYAVPFLRLQGGAVLASMALLLAPRASRAAEAAAVSAAATLGYTLLVGGDWMPLFRFLAPAVVPLAACLATLAAMVTAAARYRPSRLVAAGFLAGAAGLAMLAGRDSFRTRRAAPLFWLQPSFAPATLIAPWQPAADWLGREVRPSGLLLTSEAGFIPYLSGLRTVDSYGLAWPPLARLPRGSVGRSSLGVHTAFTAAAPAGLAERLVAAVPADAVLLQARMVRLWNRGEAPPELFAGRFRLAPTQPAGGLWVAYVPAGPRP
jgi:hypothetical protein